MGGAAVRECRRDCGNLHAACGGSAAAAAANGTHASASSLPALLLVLTLALFAPLSAQPVSQAAPACDRVLDQIARGQYGRALAQLTGVPTAGRTEAEQANLRGLALMLSGDAAKALQSFDLAIELKPDFGEARLNRAIAFLRSGEHVRAARELEPLAANDTSALASTAAYHLALAMDAMRRTAEAEKWIARALAAKPPIDDAILYDAVLKERRGDLQGAGRGYKRYLDKHPGSLVAMLRFGVSAQRAGYLPTARRYLQQVADAAPGSALGMEARKYLEMWD